MDGSLSSIESPRGRDTLPGESEHYTIPPQVPFLTAATQGGASGAGSNYPTSSSAISSSVPAIVERNELLEVGRHDVERRLSETKAKEERREAELYRLRLENRKLSDEVEKLESELTGVRELLRTQRIEAEERNQRETAAWQMRVDDAARARNDAVKRMDIAQIEIQELKEALRLARDTASEYQGKVQSLERLLEDYKDNNETFRRADADQYSHLRETIRDKEEKYVKTKAKLAEQQAEANHLRSQNAVLHQNLKMLEEENLSLKRAVISWEARHKSGNIVDVEKLAYDQRELEKLREELVMVHGTNHQLLTIMSESEELGEFVRPIRATGEDFYFCGVATVGSGTEGKAGSAALAVLDHYSDPADRLQTQPVRSRHLDHLRLSVDAHTATSRSRLLKDAKTHVSGGNPAAQAFVPIDQNRKNDYFIPRAAFDVASEFRSRMIPSVSIEDFYEFFVELNKVWWERMRNRNYMASMLNQQNQKHWEKEKRSRTPKPGQSGSLTAGSSLNRSGGGRAPSSNAPTSRGTLEAKQVELDLANLRREAKSMKLSPQLSKILAAYERLCTACSVDRRRLFEENLLLRKDLQSQVSSRDPQVLHLRQTLIQLIHDCRHGAHRLAGRLNQLVTEFDRAVDGMQLVESWRHIMTSFSETLKETYAQDVVNLTQCAEQAELAQDRMSTEFPRWMETADDDLEPLSRVNPSKQPLTGKGSGGYSHHHVYRRGEYDDLAQF
jgi:hypothetical protein